MITDDERHIPVRLCMGGRPGFAEGGLAHAADAVTSAGRFGDDMVIHINRREFEELRRNWGEPHINPDTGLPEFWNLKDLWNDVKDYVAPVGALAAGALLPGIGSALGSALPGVAGLLGSTGTQALATGLLGAGAGALINGGKGALMGGLGGVLGSYGGDLLRNGGSSALGSLVGGGDSLFRASAGNALGDSAAGLLGGGGMGTGAIAPALLMAALNLGGSAAQKDKSKKVAKGDYEDAQEQFNQPLPQYTNPRRRVPYYGVPDYTQQGEQTYFTNNHFADGGPVGYAAGGNADDGRSDRIEAVLSPGEYVMDAETVALLGNGSTEAGAARLDGLRQNIRKHKGSALAAGAISPDALSPEQYI